MERRVGQTKKPTISFTDSPRRAPKVVRFAYQVSEKDFQLTVGEAKGEGVGNPAELAAWTMVANLILNLDEVVTKE